MGEHSSISWTHATHNPWWGCTRVSPGCENCYAEQLATVRRKLPVWGVDAGRKPMSPDYWRQPAKWNRKAQAEGVRRRVFCASMADVFEMPPERNVEAWRVMNEGRARLWPIIEATPWLDWLLLTKRPQNVKHLAPWKSDADDTTRPDWPANVWLGTTAEDQLRADERIPWLIEIPAHVRFVSVEPQIAPVDLENVHPYYLKRGATSPHDPVVRIDALRGHVKGPDDMLDHKIDWVIVGGESGPGRRAFEMEWLARIVAQCKAAGVPCFTKQDSAHKSGMQGRIPDELWVKEFPASAVVPS